jgi:single-stranded-DNA-specific exonuclease
MPHQWIFPKPSQGDDFSRELGIPGCLAGLLASRGLATAAEVRGFLYPKLSALSDPFLLPNLRTAVDRILAAIDREERVVLYGDYDVDGVTSLALFARVLRAYGLHPEVFLPQRMEEGYGLSPEGVERCLATYNPQLLIAVDCGTCSVAEVGMLKERGVEVLVFDHHETKAELPECVVVNPKLGSDFHYLCSAGIVFKACHGLMKLRALYSFDLKDSLDLVALGSVADIVPLIGENRLLVQKGLQKMENTRWPGLKALMEVAAVRPPIKPVHVGFQLAPRLNAAGRLGTAEDALHLLLADDPVKAHDLAMSLDSQNRDRQELQARIIEEAEAMILQEFDPAKDAAIVLAKEGWHQGVLGIVAGRVSKAFHRPTLVAGFDESGVGKGSGRSIEGFPLVAALNQCGQELLEKFGGHEMAAGFTVSRERFERFKRAFLDYARAQLDAEALRPCLHLDAELDLATLDLEFLAQHDLLQPFGVGNLQPLFVARRVAPAGQVRVLKEKHLSFVVSHTRARDGGRCRAIYFDGARHPLPEPPWDIAFRVERNDYLGNVSVQMVVQSIRSAQ